MLGAKKGQSSPFLQLHHQDYQRHFCKVRSPPGIRKSNLKTSVLIKKTSAANELFHDNAFNPEWTFCECHKNGLVKERHRKRDRDNDFEIVFLN